MHHGHVEFDSTYPKGTRYVFGCSCGHLVVKLADYKQANAAGEAHRAAVAAALRA